jgi:hypothetical protein
MAISNSTGNLTSIEAAEAPASACKHILIPGEAHCATCGEQILFTGLERVADAEVMANSIKRATADAQLGIAWWNAMSKQARLAALKAVEPQGRASPAEAWAHWKETAGGFKCEEVAHG